MTKIAVVIPAFNEELTIANVVADLDQNKIDTIVIDDGSKDNTSILAKKAGAKVLMHPTNLGNGAALRTGIEFAFRNHYSLVVTIDGDGAHRADDILRAVKAHSDSQADLTIGSRFVLVEDLWKIPSSKIAANKFALSFFNRIFDTKKTDVASGFRVFGTKASKYLASDDSFAWTFDFLSSCISHGLKVNETPIGVRYDAQELWATNIQELKDFLYFCVRVCKPLEKDIERLISLVEKKTLSSVKFNDNWFFLHPIESVNSVMFQIQNPWHQITDMGIEIVDFAKTFEMREVENEV